MDAGNRQQTVATVSGLLPWYRDIFDEELIAAWKKDGRANLPELIKPLASARAASGIIEFSWREQRDATFLPEYAPLFGDLMARYAESAKPFLEDLLGTAPDLSPQAAATVCRILLDMPELGTWSRDALRILPKYRSAAETLLAQDLRQGDDEKSYQARTWLNRLNWNPPVVARERSSRGTDQSSPGLTRRRPGVSNPSSGYGLPSGAGPAVPRASESVTQPQTESPPARASVPPPAPGPPAPPPPTAPAPASPDASMPAPVYAGATSGLLTCTGAPIPQNAEYVFRDLPLIKMRLDYDTKIWDARLSPGTPQTQKLILRNKSASPQKRCEVRWSAIP